MKIVINSCYGGFGLSEKLISELNITDIYSLERHDQRLVEAVERLGDEANGFYSELSIVEIPDGLDYTIVEYDGMETISETWVNVSVKELLNGLDSEKLMLATKASCLRIDWKK
jgi:hypothetical protein